MIFYLLLVILMNCFPLLNFSNDQHKTTTPIHLTAKRNTWNVNVSFNALQQCMPPYPGNNINAYGLEFRLPRDAGHCDDGILICYPSTLGSTSHGFIMSDQYRIPNNEHTLFLEECKKFDAKKTRRIHWRGIKVYTMPPINGTRTHQIMLEASIASRPYNFGDVHRISLHFGDQDHLFTYATIENGKQAYADDELLREAFLVQVLHGARIKNYAGLWVLGLDMLPWTKVNKIELYINRSCTCTMEAWFIQPTDSVAQIVEPKVPKAGSKECPAMNTNGTFTIALIKEVEQAIVIDALTDVDLTNITVELSKTDENDTALMSFSIGTTDTLEVFIPDTLPYVTKDARLPNGSYKMHMEIILFMHSYVIKHNGAQMGGIFLSRNWFYGVDWGKVASIKLKLYGQMMLFEDPKATKIGDDVKKLLETPSVPPPLQPIEIIGGLLMNSTFLFRFQLLATQYFEIMFSNEATFNESSPGATALIINANRNRTVYTNVTLKVFYSDQWHIEEGRSAKNFIFGDACEVRINVTKQFFYRIQINDQDLFGTYSNSMPFCYIKNVTVQGNATLLENPVYLQPKNKLSSQFITKRLGNKLNYGDIIVLSGKIINVSNYFPIYLNHQSKECSKIWDDVATLQLKSQKPTMCVHHLHMEKAWTNLNSKSSFNIYPNKQMKLEILLANNGFYVRINSENWTPICPYYTPENKSIATKPIPPWVIDHIIVHADTFTNTEIRVEETSSTAVHRQTDDENKQESKPFPVKRIQYTQIVENNTTRVQVDYVVLVNMTLQEHFKEESEVRINFFNNALEFHDLYGTTVMRLKLTLQTRTLSFNSFINKEWMVKEQDNSNYTFTIKKWADEGDNNATLIPTKLSFQIHVTKSGFRVQLNDKGMDVNERMLNYPAKVPVYAIQYITVEYNNNTLANGNAVEVSCVPEANCVNKR
uniref:Galectin domain-containing protein n=1 Tax=Globodera rostochiensis TaxID=31243 RepID=A0A914H508_GLORO